MEPVTDESLPPIHLLLECHLDFISVCKIKRSPSPVIMHLCANACIIALDFQLIKRFDELPYPNCETQRGACNGSAPPEILNTKATVITQIEIDER